MFFHHQNNGDRVVFSDGKTSLKTGPYKKIFTPICIHILKQALKNILVKANALWLEKLNFHGKKVVKKINWITFSIRRKQEILPKNTPAKSREMESLKTRQLQNSKARSKQTS